MKIKWLKDVELEIVTNYNENSDLADTETEVIGEGEEDEVDIFDQDDKTVSLQFSNGEVSFNVPRDLFKIL